MPLAFVLIHGTSLPLSRQGRRDRCSVFPLACSYIHIDPHFRLIKSVTHHLKLPVLWSSNGLVHLRSWAGEGHLGNFWQNLLTFCLILISRVDFWVRQYQTKLFIHNFVRIYLTLSSCPLNHWTNVC